MTAEARALRLLDLPLLAMHSQRVHPKPGGHDRLVDD